MPRFCANLDWLFLELPLMDRFAAAKEAGFDAVEVLNPYDAPVQDMRDQCVWNKLEMALINCPPPNYTGGEVGYAAVPGREQRFQRDFRRALRYAREFKAGVMHVLAGEEGDHDTFVSNLRWAAKAAGKQRLTIEPINTHDRPGYFLDSLDLACEVLDAVAAPNLGLQFDAYHVARIHGDVPGRWAAVQDRVFHVQVAQVPDRTEPMGAGTDFPAFFAQLDACGYAGWVSGEYAPRTVTRSGLGWLT